MGTSARVELTVFIFWSCRSKYHSRGGRDNRHLFSQNPGGWRLEIKVWALLSLRGLSPWLADGHLQETGLPAEHVGHSFFPLLGCKSMHGLDGRACPGWWLPAPYAQSLVRKHGAGSPQPRSSPTAPLQAKSTQGQCLIGRVRGAERKFRACPLKSIFSPTRMAKIIINSSLNNMCWSN